jgi:hypothetical protein
VEHKHLKVFDFVLTIKGDEVRIGLQFSHDFEGHVDAASMPLEPAVKPIRFTRQPETHHHPNTKVVD